MSDQRKTPSRVFRIDLSDAEQKAEAARTATFDAWLDECSQFHDKLIEAMLTNLPSAAGE